MLHHRSINNTVKTESIILSILRSSHGLARWCGVTCEMLCMSSSWDPDPDPPRFISNFENPVTSQNVTVNHPIFMVDPDRGGCWPWTMITTRLLDTIFLLRYSTITDNNPSIHWPSIMLQVFTLINAVNTLIFLMFFITRGIYCTSVRPELEIIPTSRPIRTHYPITLKKQ